MATAFVHSTPLIVDDPPPLFSTPLNMMHHYRSFGQGRPSDSPLLYRNGNQSNNTNGFVRSPYPNDAPSPLPSTPSSAPTNGSLSESQLSYLIAANNGQPLSVADITEEQYYTRHPYKEKCPDCSKEFETPASFHVHHPCFERSQYYLRNQGKNDPNGMYYLCKFCNRTFFERHLLKQHIRYHLADRPFECNFCGHKFVCRPEVVAHVSSYHLKLKPFACPEPGCGKKYAEKFSLERHMDKNHGGKAFYKCKVCGEEFHWNSKWNKHKKTHQNYPEDESPVVEGNPLVCAFPGCGKRYSQKFMVGLHYEAVHLGKPRYKCDVCEKTFMFGQYLRDHKKRAGHFTENDKNVGDSVIYMDGEENAECLSGPEDDADDTQSTMDSSSQLNDLKFMMNRSRSSPLSVSQMVETLIQSSMAGGDVQQSRHHEQQLHQQNFYASQTTMDDMDDPYEPSNFLEVILIEGDIQESCEEESQVNDLSIPSHRHEEDMVVPQYPMFEESAIVEKTVNVCPDCGCRFLSEILFKRHRDSHPNINVEVLLSSIPLIMSNAWNNPSHSSASTTTTDQHPSTASTITESGIPSVESFSTSTSSLSPLSTNEGTLDPVLDELLPAPIMIATNTNSPDANEDEIDSSEITPSPSPPLTTIHEPVGRRPKRLSSSTSMISSPSTPMTPLDEDIQEKSAHLRCLGLSLSVVPAARTIRRSASEDLTTSQGTSTNGHPLKRRRLNSEESAMSSTSAMSTPSISHETSPMTSPSYHFTQSNKDHSPQRSNLSTPIDNETTNLDSSSSNNNGSTTAESNRRMSQRLTRVQRDYYKLNNPSIN